MINRIKTNIIESKANFILNPICHVADNYTDLFNSIIDYYPHVLVEYYKYLKYCKKHKIDVKNTVQYVSVDAWATPMIKGYKDSDIIAYDDDYQYVINVFGQPFVKKSSNWITMEKFSRVLKKIRAKAKELDGSVSMLYYPEWDYNLIENVFKDIDVTIHLY